MTKWSETVLFVYKYIQSVRKYLIKQKNIREDSF